MKITKYEHACLVVEEQGKKLVIDPGVFTKELPAVTDVVAIIITHEHADHIDPKKIDTLVKKNPDAILIGTKAVVDQNKTYKFRPAQSGANETPGPFSVKFFVGKHELIHKSIPLIDNFGILVNDKLYYPGDSYIKPNNPPKVLAMPSSAPWLRANEAIDYLQAVSPELAFPTHNAILSDTGIDLYNRVLGGAANNSGIDYRYLAKGESLEV